MLDFIRTILDFGLVKHSRNLVDLMLYWLNQEMGTSSVRHEIYLGYLSNNYY